MKKKIAFITGSRGEYGYIRPFLKLIEKSKELEYVLACTNMHLLPDFGFSINEIKKDGFRVSEEIYMALSGFTNASMSKSLGIFLVSITDFIYREKPDFILLAGDRGEQLMAAIAGFHMNILVAHIQAGEISGNVDGMTRHAITRYSHLHFASNRDSANRLIKMGEERFRVKLVGAPQLDEFLQGKYVSRENIYREFSLDSEKPIILMTQHPVTEESADAGQQVKITLEAVRKLQYQTVIVYPNDDAGSVAIQLEIDKYRMPFVKVKRNLRREVYTGLMRAASVIVGNSSSGIIEAPFFELPAVNIGSRQRGRYCGRNVIHVGHDAAQIAKAIEKAVSIKFRNSLKGMKNPYGDGKSSERILKILTETSIDSRLMKKNVTY